MEDEGVSGPRINPGLPRALYLFRTRQADALVVSKMDRLARSVLNAADFAASARAQGWDLMALDLGMDLATPAGKAMSNMLATFAEFEREMISVRTEEGLARARAAGRTLGRPSTMPTALKRRIVPAREAGQSFAAIARKFTAEGLSTPSGKTEWHESVVRWAYATAAEWQGNLGLSPSRGPPRSQCRPTYRPPRMCRSRPAT